MTRKTTMESLPLWVKWHVYVTLLLSTLADSSSDSGEKLRAFFIFGDSYVDAGNRNYIETIPENRAKYEPYGQNGFFKEPTGRFSDGRILVDFIADYAKLPLIPPYLQPSAEFKNGANFATGGAGVLSTTNQDLAIDLGAQLKHFEEVRRSLVEKLGAEEGEELIADAVYFFSIGINDYLGGYLGNPRMQELYQPEAFVSMVMGNLTDAIQELYEKGARRFGFLSLSPLGCLPVMRAMNTDTNKDEGCLEAASALAMAHNTVLETVLTTLAQLLQDFKYCDSKFYDWVQDRINNPSQYGFKDGVNACCGTGPYRGNYTCGGKQKGEENYELCENAEDYMWWDSYHPTERFHEQIAKMLWDGSSSVVGPHNLQQLFFSNPTLTSSIADIVDNLGDD